MATSKAPYKGDDTGFRVRDRAKALKHELTAYYVDNVKLTAKIDENPLEVAEEFGACIAAQAQNALADFDLLKFESTKQEIRAEQVDLLRRSEVRAPEAAKTVTRLRPHLVRRCRPARVRRQNSGTYRACRSCASGDRCSAVAQVN